MWSGSATPLLLLVIYSQRANVSSSTSARWQRSRYTAVAELVENAARRTLREGASTATILGNVPFGRDPAGSILNSAEHSANVSRWCGREAVNYLFLSAVRLQSAGGGQQPHVASPLANCGLQRHDNMSTETGPTALLFVVGSILGHRVIPKTIEMVPIAPPTLALSISGLDWEG